MKKPSRWISAIFAIALLVAGPAAGLAQSSFYFWWQVVDELDRPYTGQNVQCSVYRPNQHASATLHTTSTLGNNTAANDPLWSSTAGKLHFYSSQSDPVDVTCFYAFGGSAFVNKLDRFTHKIVVPRSQGRTISKFAAVAATSNTNQASGVSIPAGAVIRDVIIQNLNPRGIGTYHVSVGFAGNHAVSANVNALVSVQALNSPDEWLRPHLVSAAGAITVAADGNHRGAALSDFHASTCNGGVCGGPPLYRERSYMVHVASGLDVTYAINPGTAGAARLHIFIFWDRVHTGLNRQGLTN